MSTFTRKSGLYFIGARDGDNFCLAGFKFEDGRNGEILPAGNIEVARMLESLRSDGKMTPDSLVGTFVYLTGSDCWSQSLHGSYQVRRKTPHLVTLAHLDTLQKLEVVPAVLLTAVRNWDASSIFVNYGFSGWVQAKPIAGRELCTLQQGIVRDLVIQAGLLKE